MLQTAPGKIIFRFHARDLHLVLGTTKNGRPVRFTVKLDGTVPGDDHGADVDNNGSGTVKDHRLYQLIRQKGPLEALRNVVKHSGATSAMVELSSNAHEIELRISDQGQGFDVESAKGVLG